VSVQIGQPIDQPAVDVQLVLQPGVQLADVEAHVAAVGEQVRAGLPALRGALTQGEHGVC
jgi:hypothetical protein